MQYAVLCYQHGCYEFVRRLIPYVFSDFEFVLHQYTLLNFENTYVVLQHLILSSSFRFPKKYLLRLVCSSLLPCVFNAYLDIQLHRFPYSYSNKNFPILNMIAFDLLIQFRFSLLMLEF
jgi:hypothetical protein